MKSFDFVNKFKVMIIIPLVLVLIGTAGYFVNGGFNTDVEFSGGTEIVIDLSKTADGTVADINVEDVKKVYKEAIAKDASTVQKQGETNLLIRASQMTSEEVTKVVEAVNAKYALTEDSMISSNNISPTVGLELVRNAFIAVLIAVILMLCYITVRFEFLSGAMAVVALVHDVLIMLAAYALLQTSFDSKAIAALLTIIGYSINNTIVVFDRIRENGKKRAKNETFKQMVNKSIKETLVRSINTSVTTFVTIFVLYIVGVQAIKEFALPLMVGVVAGTFSSIFIAAPAWALLKTPKKK